MPIKISCQCGQRFQAPDHMAGKKVRCPKCGVPLTIPTGGRQAESSSSMTSMLDEIGVKSTPVGGKRCPQCNTTLAGQAVFCVECGYNLETNEFVNGLEDQPTPQGGSKQKSFGNPLLDKAAKDLAYEKSQTQISQDPRSWYTYFIGLLLCIVFLAVGAITSMSLEAKKNKTPTSLPDPGLTAFWGVFAVGIMVIIAPWCQITYRAFQESKLHGFLCLTLLYCPVYAIMQWRDLKRQFGMWLFGVILMAGSYGTYYYMVGDIPESLF